MATDKDYTHIAITKTLHKKLNIMKATDDDCKNMTDVIDKLLANQKEEVK